MKTLPARAAPVARQIPMAAASGSAAERIAGNVLRSILMAPMSLLSALRPHPDFQGEEDPRPQRLARARLLLGPRWTRGGHGSRHRRRLGSTEEELLQVSPEEDSHQDDRRQGRDPRDETDLEASAAHLRRCEARLGQDFLPDGLIEARPQRLLMIEVGRQAGDLLDDLDLLVGCLLRPPTGGPRRGP